MASSSSPATVELTALAAAKLERQKKRIEEAEAALTAPQQADRQRQNSRGKGKWKPFDFGGDSTQHSTHDGGNFVAESRINVFRAPSRGTSLTRPMSRMSQQTAVTDIDQHDTLGDDSDFQLWTGRKGRKNPGLNAFEDRQPARQTTVEATFNKREMTDVFGNELPGPGYVDSNPGLVNGQVQFIQHPNGDVAAHQWSEARFEWENIGHFSNIRKKTEGQLAADRLKGETAWQALQQNTLAYFRTIAKQREAAVMGMPFGAKEIQATLPDMPRVKTPPVLQTYKHHAFDTQAEPADARWSPPTLKAPTEPRAFRVEHAYPGSKNTQPNLRFNPYLNYTSAPDNSHQDDPFVSGDQYGGTYTGQQRQSSQEAPRNRHRTYGQMYSDTTTRRYEYRAYPPAPQPQYQVSSGDVPRYRSVHQDAQAALLRAQQARDFTHQDLLAARRGLDTTIFRPTVHYQYAQGSKAENLPTSDPEEDFQQMKRASEARSAMRESLMKLGQTAERRNLSQSNIGRTVLYDPFQHQSPAEKAPKATNTRTNDTQAVNMNGSWLNQASVASLSVETPKETSPLAPLVASSYADYDTSFTQASHFRGSSNTTLTQQTPGLVLSEPLGDQAKKAGTKQTHDEELSNWWKSGTKFARHEEYYDRITASNHRFGTSASSAQDKPGVVDMTRLLIPVYENLASYIDKPMGRPAPVWAVERSPQASRSFFDHDGAVELPDRYGSGSRRGRWEAVMPAFGGFGGGSAVGGV